MKAILWDFDGTLARREGGWTAAVTQVLASALPDRTVTQEDVRPYLQTGFPWHSPEVSHKHLRTADEWWETLAASVLAPVFDEFGVSRSDFGRLVDEVRLTYCDTRQWQVCADTLPTLWLLRADGWSHRILSNHVPELPSIVESLGLSELFDDIHNSAQTGFEKPNPQAFKFALRALPPDANVWMVGDNMPADIWGAESAGIRAILVRRTCAEARWSSEGLAGVIDIVVQSW